MQAKKYYNSFIMHRFCNNQFVNFFFLILKWKLYDFRPMHVDCASFFSSERYVNISYMCNIISMFYSINKTIFNNIKSNLIGTVLLRFYRTNFSNLIKIM